MPLVVPGISNVPGNDQQNWMSKLAGKKIGDSTDETNFAKSDLPHNSRVLGSDAMKTMDHDPKRMNVHVGKDGTVENVTYG